MEASADPGNRKVSRVALSPAGAELAERLQSVLAQAAAATLAPLDPVERRQLIALLARVAPADG